MPLKDWFIADDRRLRSGWRVALFMLASFLVSVAVMLPFIVLYLVAQQSAEAGRLPRIPNGTAMNLAAATATLPFVLLVAWVFRRFLDRRSWRSLGFWWDRDAPCDLGLGFVAGAGVILLAAGLLFATGACRYAGLAGPGGSDVWALMRLALLAGGIAAAALLEEVVCRGYIQGNVAERSGPVVAIATSSLIFGVMHGLNPNVTVLAGANLVLAGVLLGLAYERFRTLWLPWGLHFGWNLVMGPALGIPVSGTSMPSALHCRLEGPDWWSGGAFGIEGGLAATLAMAVAVAALAAWRGRPARPVEPVGERRVPKPAAADSPLPPESLPR
ncbi:MAG TPA: type II CAAX endopeptidase family protein [Planctomycetota bacterium]|nr:type II CAAX endopeptidase family protein [Planctomycetota bacterium]